MSALAILIIIIFGLVVIQQGFMVFGTLAGDMEGGFEVAGMVSIPIALVAVAAFIVALVT